VAGKINPLLADKFPPNLLLDLLVDWSSSLGQQQATGARQHPDRHSNSSKFSISVFFVRVWKIGVGLIIPHYIIMSDSAPFIIDSNSSLFNFFCELFLLIFLKYEIIFQNKINFTLTLLNSGEKLNKLIN